MIRSTIFLFLIAITIGISLSHEELGSQRCCPKGMQFNFRILSCVCPPGTYKIGRNNLCCPHGAYATPQMTCACPSPKHLNPDTNRCELCPSNHIWDITTKRCVCPPHMARNSSGWCVCSGSSWWNPTTKSCTTCPANKIRDLSSNTCVCPQGLTHVNISGYCVDCRYPAVWNPTG